MLDFSKREYLETVLRSEFEIMLPSLSTKILEAFNADTIEKNDAVLRALHSFLGERETTRKMLVERGTKNGSRNTVHDINSMVEGKIYCTSQGFAFSLSEFLKSLPETLTVKSPLTGAPIQARKMTADEFKTYTRWYGIRVRERYIWSCSPYEKQVKNPLAYQRKAMYMTSDTYDVLCDILGEDQ